MRGQGTQLQPMSQRGQRPAMVLAELWPLPLLGLPLWCPLPIGCSLTASFDDAPLISRVHFPRFLMLFAMQHPPPHPPSPAPPLRTRPLLVLCHMRLGGAFFEWRAVYPHLEATRRIAPKHRGRQVYRSLFPGGGASIKRGSLATAPTLNSSARNGTLSRVSNVIEGSRHVALSHVTLGRHVPG